MKILALDLARSTGWAVGAPDTRPVYGSFRIQPGKASALRMGREVNRLIQDHEVTHVFFEQPIKGSADRKKGRGGNYQKMRYLFGIAYLVEFLGEMSDCKVYEVNIGTWRKHFLGSANYNRGDAKRAAFTRCKQLGHTPETDDVAEAIGILDYACSLYSKSHGIQTAPLFASGGR